MTNPDYRTRAGREAEILAQLEIDGGLSVAWLSENRQRAAAVERLIARGVLHRLPCKHPSVMRFEAVREIKPRSSFWAGFWTGLGGGWHRG